MKKKLNKKSLTSLAPLILLTIFSACILIVLLSGADIYRKITQRDQNSLRTRTLEQYLTTRLRQSDMDGMVYVSTFDDADGRDTLYIQEQLNGRVYHTRIYAHDGSLRELFAAEDVTFDPADGTAISPLKDLHFTLCDHLLTAEITYEDDVRQTLHIVLRSGKEAGL